MNALGLVETLLEVELPLEEQVQLLRALQDEKITSDLLCDAIGILESKVKTAHEIMEAIDMAGTRPGHPDLFDLANAATLILGGTGVPIMKHGHLGEMPHADNLDVLAPLGIRIPKTAKTVYHTFQDEGLVFINTSSFYPQLALLAPACSLVSAASKTPTLFCLLNSFANPFRPRYMALGVADPELMTIFAETLLLLGRQGVVFSTKDNTILKVRRGVIDTHEISCEHLGLKPLATAALQGGDPFRDAELIIQILAGEELGPKRDAALLNAAIAHLAYQPVFDLEEALDRVSRSLATGAALRKFKHLQGTFLL